MQAAKIYRKVEIESGNDHDALKISFNFDKIIKRMENFVQVMEKFTREHDFSAFDDYNKQKAYIDIQAESDPDDIRATNTAEHFVEYLIFEIFIVMNLSAPGSCGFSNSFLQRVPPEKRFDGKIWQHNIGLNNHLFESSLYVKQDFNWLSLEMIDVPKTVSWIRHHCSEYQMLPRNDVAKCIFALMHIAKSEIGPMSLIWVFYALESLYQCRVGENFSTLSRRIALLFELDEKATKTMKKKLRELYDIRSSLVHGGAKVVHPLRNERLDERAEGASWRYIQTSDFGVALLVGSLQRVIDKGWSDIKFPDVLQGVEL